MEPRYHWSIDLVDGVPTLWRLFNGRRVEGFQFDDDFNLKNLNLAYDRDVIHATAIDISPSRPIF